MQVRARIVNEAEGERNRKIPAARGAAERVVKEAEGYKIGRINRAKGETEAFLAVLTEYRKAEDITRRRLYLEAMEAALPKVARKVTLRSTASGLYHLRGETKEDVGALLYVLSCRAFRQFSANIYALAAHTGKRGSSRVSVYLSLPDEIDFEEAQAIAEKWE